MQERIVWCKDNWFLYTWGPLLAPSSLFQSQALLYLHGVVPDLISPVRASLDLHPVVSFVPPQHAGRAPVPATGGGDLCLNHLMAQQLADQDLIISWSYYGKLGFVPSLKS